MNKPVLVVMAAGMGSRYGGMKQIDPVGPCGQVIVDYSLYDARRAGFETVIFVIKHEIEDAFKAAIGERVSKAMDVKYAFQQLDELPEGYTRIHKGVAYDDRAFRLFFQRFGGEEWFRRTIFVFVADHVSSEKFAEETRSYPGNMHIIGFIYTPDGALRGEVYREE